MAHDFSIERISTKETAFFFGYGGGALYKAFGCEQFNNGISGSNNGIEITKIVCHNALAYALFLLADYPDTDRANDLKRFLHDVVLPSSDDELFYAHFS
ncbi:hypothetical protein [Candidatus Methylobacter favarea]|uniref:hypothetical protein n=1 Tax=Candidatus Methylobacter favarea TaxID=2707345 RepID=UPI00157D1149|nr:hypothetical protein [Candidatus Methylobacter favarea]